MWLYKLSPICLASLCTEMCIITYQDDATDQQIAHWLLTVKVQVLFHGSPWGICGPGTENFSDYFGRSVCWHCINVPPEFISHPADGQGNIRASPHTTPLEFEKDSRVYNSINHKTTTLFIHWFIYSHSTDSHKATEPYGYGNNQQSHGYNK